MTAQGSVYAAFIEGELRVERERRAALDARGLSVVTSSASLVTLLTAVGAFVTSEKGFTLPGAAVVPLLATLGSFTVAVVLGILANRSRYYHVALAETLYGMVTEHWGDDEIDSRNNVAELNIRTIHTLRLGNDMKANLLTWALSAQLMGVVALSTTVIIAVTVS
ncbi:hypothetical protein WEI85_34865 [Actinomycetes bacterium KLBMP 9797]